MRHRRVVRGGEVLTEPTLDHVFLRRRHQPLVSHDASAFAILGHHVLVGVQDQNQPALLGAPTMIQGIDNVTGLSHSSF